ncbi:hypothetical protein JEG43_06295 [Anoxybacillus sp. LAT_35]|uniref:hypothetical protein n=1 Tax=unclassified Anoxybacillus TaxID=2639704 RepID=UPI001EDC8682|nr:MULTISPECIES: hypothetical protein [unclassified Anoxybacillus]MCG5026697.1 hypothetical protein [Anoxybacillus flavithermus]MCG6196054.1 hypothetical protein [Anoxybacillus sp. LAT_38]MCG3083197.1 hypothetical protein [Anoxybacillus sp. LAT27]MCG6170615.1 hypothetical protein [Anoxybacillus sp. LAT_11]MCG6174756.1 hypothetical protein [Anoxybacillus sp. LAT_31]
MNVKELISLIKEEVPNKAIDLMDSLELLKETIADTLTEILKKSHTAFQQRNLTKWNELNRLIDQIVPIEERIAQIIEELDLDVTVKENEMERRTLPNYSDYLVDSNVEHTLYEDYTHRRPCAFKMNDNPRIEVSTWKEMLIKTCEILMEKDEEKFLSFEHLDKMNGKKRKYFSVSSDGMREPVSIKGKMYIETLMSSNGFRNLVIKLLKEYNLKISDYKIYLRADYSELNQ